MKKDNTNVEAKKRINYLFQAAHLMNNIARNANEESEVEQFSSLSRILLFQLRSVSSTTVISLFVLSFYLLLIINIFFDVFYALKNYLYIIIITINK